MGRCLMCPKPYLRARRSCTACNCRLTHRTDEEIDSETTLAFAQLAFVVVVGALFLSLGKPDYRALGSAPAPQSANAIVMFRADASEAHLRELLQSNGASMVGGPTTAGAYLLKVPSASRASTLERLRADRNVTMAQPIDGPAS